MGIEVSKGNENPDKKTTLDEKTKTEILPEHTSQSDDDKLKIAKIAATEISKVVPAISAFVNSKYGESPEPPTSSEPSEPSEDSKS